jgi:hypothetical protein
MYIEPTLHIHSTLAEAKKFLDTYGPYYFWSAKTPVGIPDVYCTNAELANRLLEERCVGLAAQWQPLIGLLWAVSVRRFRDRVSALVSANGKDHLPRQQRLPGIAQVYEPGGAGDPVLLPRSCI